MKQFLTGLLLATTSTLALAQENSLAKGKFFVGGSLGFSSASSKSEYKTGGTTFKSDGPKTTTFSLMPSFGYMLSNQLAVGTSLGFTSGRIKQDDDGDEEITTNNSLVFSPNVSYFLPFAGSQRFGFLVNAAIPVSLGTIKHEIKNNNTSVSHKMHSRSFGFAVTPGLYYFPASRFMLTAQMGSLLRFTSSTVEDKNNDTKETDTSNQFQLLNFSTMGLSFGGSFFF